MVAQKSWYADVFHTTAVGPIYHIPGLMDQFEYIKTLEEIMLLAYAEEEILMKWVFQQDNDLKNMSKQATSDKKD